MRRRSGNAGRMGRRTAARPPLRGPPRFVITPLTVSEMLSPQECDAVVAAAGRAGFVEAALVGGRSAREVRAARIAWLDDEGEAAWIFARLVETVRAANRDHFGFALSDFADRIQVACYDGAEAGGFDWHADIGQGALAARRKLTLVAQLSDPDGYEGGALELNPAGRPVEAERRRGAATLFPGFVLHRVAPVARGRRYSLTAWAHGPAFA